MTRLAVPDRDREHAVEPPPGHVGPLPPGREYHLRVAAGREAVSKGAQLVPQCAIVVDFAIEDDDVTSVLAEDRLIASLQIDDAEPTHAEAEIAVHEGALAVGPTMDDHVALTRDQCRVDRLEARRILTGYPADDPSPRRSA